MLPLQGKEKNGKEICLVGLCVSRLEGCCCCQWLPSTLTLHLVHGGVPDLLLHPSYSHSLQQLQRQTSPLGPVFQLHQIMSFHFCVTLFKFLTVTCSSIKCMQMLLKCRASSNANYIKRTNNKWIMHLHSRATKLYH